VEVKIVSLDEIVSAAARIDGACMRTPVVWLPTDDTRAGGVWLKLESLQRTGAFKLRGASNALIQLDEAARRAGVVTHSSGNHGQAVACAAARLGIAATVVMPETASAWKVARTRSWGAEIVQRPASETVAHARELARTSGATLVHPFDDLRIIAGQGTVGLELADQVQQVDAVLVPVGGGGLISGVAAALKQLRPATRIIAVEPALAGDLNESFRSGERTEWSTDRTGRTIADGLRSSSVGELTWAHIRRYVDDVLTVTDDDIRSAMRLLAEVGKLVVEPSGAVSLAALLAHPDRVPGVVAAVVTGGNIDLDGFAGLVCEGRPSQDAARVPELGEEPSGGGRA
jgi:threonine dehydratase